MSIIQPSQLLKITAFRFSMWIGNSADGPAKGVNVPRPVGSSWVGSRSYHPISGGRR
jgi:hypothetical protein